LDNVGTCPYRLEVFDFILEGIPFSPKHFGTIDLFDGIFGSRRTMDTHKDHGKGTIAQLFIVIYYDRIV
jgi:hypothetical protein